ILKSLPTILRSLLEPCAQVTRLSLHCQLAAVRNRPSLKIAMRTSISARANLELIEENYRRWQRNPEAVDSGWSAFFEGFELGNLPQRDGASATAAREAGLQTRGYGFIYGYF